MKKKPKEQNYKTMKVWPETHKKIKDEAHEKDIPMTELLDEKFKK